MAKTNPRDVARRKRQRRIRKKLSGTAERPRLAVFRSSKHIYAQLINDVDGVTIAAASTLSPGVKEEGKNLGNIEGAKKVGLAVADKAKEAGVTSVIFDRGGYIYHGKVKALADAAREGGLDF